MGARELKARDWKPTADTANADDDLFGLKMKPGLGGDGVLVGEARGAVASCVGIRCDAISGISRIPGQAARSIGGSIGFVARVCQPSTLRMLI